MKNFIVFIPARGGSKGIPKKNLSDLGGKPLIAHTIEVGLACVESKRVVVSSDSEEILQISKKFGAETLLRPESFSADESPTSEALKHFIEINDFENEGIDTIILMQATSPFRTIKHLNEALEKYKNSNVETLISVSEYEVSPYRSYYFDATKKLSPVFGSELLSMRRQDYKKTYAANGAIYIFPIKKFLEVGNIPLTDLSGYEMKSPDDLDIDTPLDLEFSRFVIEKGLVKL